MTISLHKTLMISCTFSLLAACGGGDSDSSSGGLYSGSTSSAVASEENKSALVAASVLGAKQVSNSSELPLGASSEQSGALSAANQTLFNLLQLNSLPVAAQQDFSEQFCTGGGSASGEGSQSTFTFVFTNCVLSAGLTMDGTAITTTNDNGTSIIEYKNFTMTIGEESYTLNVTAHCDAQDECTFSSDFVAVNGTTYRISDTALSGNSSSGYSISATVFDSELGSVTFTSSNMLFNCENGYPSTGSLLITDSQENEISVNIESCDSYTVTFNGNAELLTWQ